MDNLWNINFYQYYRFIIQLRFFLSFYWLYFIAFLLFIKLYLCNKGLLFIHTTIWLMNLSPMLCKGLVEKEWPYSRRHLIDGSWYLKENILIIINKNRFRCFQVPVPKRNKINYTDPRLEYHMFQLNISAISVIPGFTVSFPSRKSHGFY